MSAWKYVLATVLIISIISLILTGCSNSIEQPHDFFQLISQAEKFRNRDLTLEAYYFGGFEISVLCGLVGPATSGEWKIVPRGTLVWVEGGIPQDLLDLMYKQTTGTSGYAEHIGRLLISGIFETGDRYGHLGGYLYQINLTKAELLEWSPPGAAGAPTIILP